MNFPSKVRRIFTAAIPFCLLLSMIAAVLFTNPVYNRSVTRLFPVSAGRVDLASNPHGINQIQGEWRFWWKNFVDDPARMPPDRFAVLPGAWSNAGISDRNGYASYAVTVTGLDPGKTYAFRTGQTLSACRIVINGKNVASIGTPSRSAIAEVPFWNSILARFTPRPDGSADIVLQISNYHDRCGGSNASLYIGEASLMYRMEDSQKLTEGFVFAVLSIMGLFFLALYLFRHKDVPFLWFAGICMIVGFRTLCYDGFVLLAIAPGLSWPIFFRLGYLTFPFAMVFYAGFLRSLFPSLVHPIHFSMVVAIFLPDSLIIVFAPEFVSGLLLTSFQIAGLCTVLYGVCIIVIASIQRLESALWLLVGFSFAVISFVYDVLVSMWIISGVSISHLGMCLCLFSLALMVIERYSSSFYKAQRLSEQLHLVNHALRRFVPAEFLAYLKKDSIVDVHPGDCVELVMAILSADIRSFTSIAERMTPDNVFMFLNDYLELVGPIIRENDGFIAKYEGDGFFALFPKGAESAVHAAVQMQSAISQRNRAKPGQSALVVGIGIDAGNLALGTIGDNTRLDGTVISNCVKCAGKFESVTKQFQSSILINEAVYSGIAEPLAYFLRPVDRIDIGGKASFLFEIYANDTDTIRELKWSTQSDLEHALYAWFSGQYEEAKFFILRVLVLFPEDPVAGYYAKRLELE